MTGVWGKSNRYIVHLLDNQISDVTGLASLVASDYTPNQKRFAT